MGSDGFWIERWPFAPRRPSCQLPDVGRAEPELLPVGLRGALHDLLDRLPAGSTIAELGAGANPVLAAEPRVLSGELTLYKVDISQAELDKAPAVGEKLCLAVAVPDLPLSSSVDLAFSQMLGGAQVAGAGSPPCAGVVQLLRLCGGTAARMTSRDTMILLRAV